VGRRLPRPAVAACSPRRYPHRREQGGTMTQLAQAPDEVRGEVNADHALDRWKAGRGDVGPQRPGLQPGDGTAGPGRSTSRRGGDRPAPSRRRRRRSRVARAVAVAPHRALLPDPRLVDEHREDIAKSSRPSTARCSPTRWARSRAGSR
jgi:hypothetical protein